MYENKMCYFAYPKSLFYQKCFPFPFWWNNALQRDHPWIFPSRVDEDGEFVSGTSKQAWIFPFQIDEHGNFMDGVSI